ncbi:MAG: MBL fold metallo-hydrolase [Deltaproteobacteria bacterium]|nr:MBL fold metallo-hydrolase [Deltaproteobacteria bacterium]
MKYHRIPVGPFATNCILVKDAETNEGLIVDPGGDGDTIADRIRTLGIKPVGILLTHGHMDHCMETSRLSHEFDVPITMHSADLPLYQNLGKQMEALMGPSAAAAFSPDALVEPTGFLDEGDTVVFGKSRAEVMHLPGHSPGGIGFLFRQDPDVLMCGDTIFRDGVGRTDLWGGNWETLLKSIREKVFTLDDDTVLVSGHGAETTVGREKRHFPY